MKNIFALVMFFIEAWLDENVAMRRYEESTCIS
jgi:hypothetical protein